MAHRPSPPTSCLPPLSRLPSYSLVQISQAVDNLRSIYCAPATPPKPVITLPKRSALRRPRHLIHDTSVPDSGYASADGEEEDEEDEIAQEVPDEPPYDPDVLRSDMFEREFTIRWLTSFTARSDVWVYLSDDEAETDARAVLVDAAASLLSTFAGAEEEEEDITRTFTFPTGSGSGAVQVELNDAPLLSEDHTSVGLQSWGSSILLAERMCMHPAEFGLVMPADRPLRVLELGAGTGLLSIAAAKLLASSTHQPSVVATDYHPSVLANLQTNIETNFPRSSRSSVDVLPLDWQTPVYEGLLDQPFDVILAADVVYHPEHARWIKSCVERLLAPGHGVFWLIIPIRPTGRHEGMVDTVEAVFPLVDSVEDRVRGELAILTMEGLGKHTGVGRADEGGYRMYKIGWA